MPQDSGTVEGVGGSGIEGAYQVGGKPLRIGQACGVGQVIGHGSLDRSRLDGDDADSGGVEAAAQSLEEEGKRALCGSKDVVGAAAAVSRDGGDGGQASRSALLAVGGGQRA